MSSFSSARRGDRWRGGGRGGAGGGRGHVEVEGGAVRSGGTSVEGHVAHHPRAHCAALRTAREATAAASPSPRQGQVRDLPPLRAYISLQPMCATDKSRHPDPGEAEEARSGGGDSRDPGIRSGALSKLIQAYLTVQPEASLSKPTGNSGPARSRLI